MEDLQVAGLAQPCVVRLNLFTLAEVDRFAVIAQLAKMLPSGN